MAGERIEDIYSINLQGNYQQELDRLSRAIDESKKGWRELKGAFTSSGAALRQSKRDVKGLSKELQDAAAESNKSKTATRQVEGAAKALAKTYNLLASETNRLNRTRLAEITVLKQAQIDNDPRIIQARAETSALVSLTRQLQKNTEKRVFAKLAADAGLKVSADGTKLLNLEAQAAERAAKAQEKLALAELLRQQGLDLQGNKLKEPPGPRSIDGKLTERGEKNSRKTAQRRQDELAEKLRTLELLKQNQGYLENAKALKVAQAEMDKLLGIGNKTESTFNRVSFTFRRLIGIMAAFTVARVVAREFSNLITTAITFNASLESTRVGLAGLIAASAEVRDRFGGALTVDEQVIRAQDIAIVQMNQLRRDALETAASYDELARAFQSAVAPGLQSNLTVDQIRKLTVNISQAASGLGLAQDQLAEEIRAIFQGTISARNTRIATALGISNTDIQRAKELGNLFEFLDGRFRAISKTGKLLMNTFTGQLSNASDAFQQLLAASSKPLFEQLKAALRDIQSAIFEVVNDAVVFKPEALKAFQGLFEGLANGVQGIRAAFRDIDPQGFADSLALIGQGLGFIASTVANVFSVAFNLASPVLQVISGIVGIFTKMVAVIREGVVGGIGAWLAQTALVSTKLLIIGKTFTKIWAIVRGATLSVVAFARAMTLSQAASAAMIAPLTRVQALARGIRNAFSRLLVPVIALTAAVVGLDKIIEAFGGSFSFVDTIGAGFGFLNDQLDKMLGAVDGLQESATQVSDQGLGQLVNSFRDLVSGLDDLNKELKKTLRESIADLGTAAATLGLPSSVADQLGAQLEEQKKFKESIRETVKALDVQRNTISQAAEVNARDIARVGLLEQDTLEEKIRLLDLSSKLVKKQKELESKSFPASALPQDPRAVGLKPTDRIFSADQDAKEYRAILKILKDVEDRFRQLSGLESQASEQRLQSQGQLLALKDQEAILQGKINDVEKTSLANAEAQIKKLLIIDNFRREQESSNFESQIKAAQAAALAVQETASLRAGILAKEAESSALSAEFKLKETELLKGILRVNQAIAQEAAKGQNADLLLTAGLLKQSDLLNRQLSFEQRLFTARKARADFEERLAKLQAEGTAGQGFARGVNVLADKTASDFAIGEQFSQDLVGGVSSTLGTAVASAFDPRANFELEVATANLALSLATNLATKLIEQQLASILSSFITDPAGSPTAVAGKAAEGAAFAAPVVAAGESFLLSSSLSATFIADAGVTAGAAISAAAAELLFAATVAAASGGPAGVAAFGGSVNRLRTVPGTHAGAQGFARGSRRPLGIDGRDTIPAWLRRGEWVIRPESVKKAEKKAPGFMSMLNSGRINFDALPGLTAAARGHAPARSAAPRRSFATGGQVTSTPVRSGGGVQVLQFHDEQTMDRALHAGSASMTRFARTKRAAYRAALGLEPGT